MRIPFHHSLHLFQPTSLPPMPSASGGYYHHHSCQHCGLSGVADDQRHVLYLSHVPKADQPKVYACKGAGRGMATKAMIVATDLPLRGARFQHLLPGTTHPLVLPPYEHQNDILAGAWVSSPAGPVRLDAGDYQPISLRVRTRCANITAQAQANT